MTHAPKTGAAGGSLSGVIFQFCLGIPAFFTTQHSDNYVRSKKAGKLQKLKSCTGAIF